jgi:hypothetical protein
MYNYNYQKTRSVYTVLTLKPHKLLRMCLAYCCQAGTLSAPAKLKGNPNADKKKHTHTYTHAN